MTQQMTIKEMEYEHPARLFVHDLFNAKTVNVDENLRLISFNYHNLLEQTDWVMLNPDGFMRISSDLQALVIEENFIDPEWFTFELAIEWISQFEKRSHVKIALPIGEFVDPIAKRFTKEMVKSKGVFIGQGRLKLKIDGQWVQWDWTHGVEITVKRNGEELGSTGFFTYEVARFLLHQWQEQWDAV